MNDRVHDCKSAAEFFGIKAKHPEKVIIKMIHEGKLRAFLPSRKQGYRIHIKAMEDAMLLGNNK